MIDRTLDISRTALIRRLGQNGITDKRVLDAIAATPREAFVMPELYPQSYDDVALPIACGQTISQPSVVAAMTQELDITDRHKVLEIGTGSGYQASILARLCRRLYTIERHKPLMQRAEDMFRLQRLNNITPLVGDGFAGWPAVAPFDRIIVTAAAVKAPQALLDQLAVGGIMVIPVGAISSTQQLRKITRVADDLYSSITLMNVRFVPMVPDVAEVHVPRGTSVMTASEEGELCAVPA